MPTWTQKQLDDYNAKNKRDIAWLRPAVSEPIERPALVIPPERKKTRQQSAESRYRITYAVYAVRPMDFDNISIKKIQDELVQQGLLPDDNWKVLEGCVISRKAKSKDEQRTEIEIELLTPKQEEERE